MGRKKAGELKETDVKQLDGIVTESNDWHVSITIPDSLSWPSTAKKQRQKVACSSLSAVEILHVVASSIVITVFIAISFSLVSSSAKWPPQKQLPAPQRQMVYPSPPSPPSHPSRPSQPQTTKPLIVKANTLTGFYLKVAFEWPRSYVLMKNQKNAHVVPNRFMLKGLWPTNSRYYNPIPFDKSLGGDSQLFGRATLNWASSAVHDPRDTSSNLLE